MSRSRATLFILLLAGTVGCSKVLPPAPEGTHWKHSDVSDTLYCNSDGSEVAKVIDGRVFISQSIHATGENFSQANFESHELALAYAVKYSTCTHWEGER